MNDTRKPDTPSPPEGPQGRAIGGVARMEGMTPQERKAQAQRAAAVRWGKPITATHKGNFKGQFGIDVECYVLDDATHTAVISQTGMAKALGLSSRGNALPRFVGGQAMSGYVGAELGQKLQNPFIFQYGTPGAAHYISTIYGFDATILIDLCKAIVNADAGGKLQTQQKKTAMQAAVLLAASAKSGIKGLVYALAGYNPTADEVIQAFRTYIQEEAREYEREFPPQLYREWYRLYQLTAPVRGRPWKAKGLTIDHVYHPLAKSNGKILKLTREHRATSDSRREKLHQFLSEVGVKALRTHLGQVLGVARISKTRHEYERHIHDLFGVQLNLDLPE